MYTTAKGQRLASILLIVPLILLFAFNTTVRAEQAFRPAAALDPELSIVIAPDLSSITLENSQILVRYGPFTENGIAQFAITDFIHKSVPAVDQAGNYLDADEDRRTVKRAELILDTDQKKTVRIVWNTADTPYETIHEVSIYPNQAFLRIDYVAVQRTMNIVDMGLPGGTDHGKHIAYGSTTWATVQHPEWPAEYGGFVTLDYAPSLGSYYNRHSEDGVNDPRDGGALAYKGHFIIGVIRPLGTNAGMGIGRVMPVARIPVVKLLLNIDTRRGMEFLPLGTTYSFTGYLFPSLGGESNLISMGMQLADRKYGDFQAGTFQSDDFNTCTGLDETLWTFVNPKNDSSFATNGTQVSISVPGGSDHDIWGTGPATFANNAPHIIQPVANEDFMIEAKFDSVLDSRYQMEGILVKEDDDSLLRFEFHHNGSDMIIYAGKISDGVGESLSTKIIPTDGTTPLYMRIQRIGSNWTQTYSLDGTSWQLATTFPSPLTINEAGFFAGNTGAAGTQPAFTAVVDYFFNAADPIEPEDSGLNTVAAIVSPAGSGTITLSPEKASYTCNETVNVSATPNPGFVFDHWEGDLSGTENTGVLSANGAKSITAVFTPLAYTLDTSTVVGQGEVTVDPQKETYAQDEQVSLTAIPALGWKFDHWEGDLSGSANPASLTMDGSKAVTAVFTQLTYTLTVNIDGQGDVTRSPNKSSFTYGEKVTLTAVEDPNFPDWKFAQWSGGANGTQNPVEITITQNTTVTATFNVGGVAEFHLYTPVVVK